MAENSPYKLSLKGPGITIDKDVDYPTAVALLQIAFGVPSPAAPEVVTSPSSGGIQAPLVRSQRLSLREFIDEAGGRSNPAKIASIGRYMRDHEAQPDFSRDDIRGRFRTAGEPTPANLWRDFLNALQSGWIAEDPQNKGRFYVTRKGDEAIERRFEGVAVSSVSRKKRRRVLDVDGGGGADDVA